MLSCHAQYVGKNRNGTPRYWCTAHHAPMSDGKGNRLAHCLSAQSRVPESEGNSLTIDPKDYPGGIALWCAALAVYDTTAVTVEPGIHLQTGKEAGGAGPIDKAFRYVHIRHRDGAASFDDLAAISCLSSHLLGHSTEYLVCPHCGEAHCDKDWFAASPHKKHLCAACGRNFYQPAANIGNPIMKAKGLIEGAQALRKAVRCDRVLEIRQKDFPFGIAIWGAPAALLWTFPEAQEEGIHVHAYDQNSIFPAIDATYGRVQIDGISLDAEMVRLWMAQMALPYLKGRVGAFRCPQCHQPHWDVGDQSCLPHTQHRCQYCGGEFKTRMKSIGNPMGEIISELHQHTDLPLKTGEITGLYPGLEGW